MIWHRIHFPIVWIAVLAILWTSFALSLNIFLPSSTGTGTRLVTVDTGEDSASDSIHAGVHCPYYRFQQDLPAISHAPSMLVLADARARGVFLLPAPTPPLAVAVRPAHYSRAPSQLS